MTVKLPFAGVGIWPVGPPRLQPAAVTWNDRSRKGSGNLSIEVPQCRFVARDPFRKCPVAALGVGRIEPSEAFLFTSRTRRHTVDTHLQVKL